VVGGIFAILDDIAMLMDDVAVVTKVSAKNTIPLLGDDLAINAQKASGYKASRELPVLWEITKGSFRNKLIILPLAFVLSAIAPWLIAPVLILGGFYLSFEGVEVIYHYFHLKFAKSSREHHNKKELTETQKIKSAIVTDFILSVEIIIVALSTVIEEPFIIQVLVVSLIAIFATVGVYGVVALLVRMDDVGYYLIKKSTTNNLQNNFGKLLVKSLPKVIKILSFLGTIAMLLVAGGLIVHHIKFLHSIYDEYFAMMSLLGFEFFTALLVGGFILILLKAFNTIYKK